MNVGNIGQARRPPGPKKSEIDAALNLITVLGGSNTEGKKMLSELRAAAEHNEKLLTSLDEQLKALDDLEKREHALAKVKADVDAKLEKLDRFRAEFEAYEADVKAGRYG